MQKRNSKERLINCNIFFLTMTTVQLRLTGTVSKERKCVTVNSSMTTVSFSIKRTKEEGVEYFLQNKIIGTLSFC